jgi:hypothetical protein
MIIKLTETECEFARILGAKRRGSNRANNITDKLVARENPMDMDIQGVGAEIAFAKAYGFYPPFDIGIRSGSCDFVVNGKTVDVKTSKHKNARLIVAPDKINEGHSCDIYVLATGELPTFNFRGYALKDDICNPLNLIKLRSMVYALGIKELKSMP